MTKPSGFTRRDFLRATGLAAGAAAALGGAALVPGQADAKESHQHGKAEAVAKAEGAAVRGRMFFTNDLEFSTLSQAVERIFPKDETGPGAIELAVPYFIDNQLAGAWGYNAREYTAGPHAPGASTQGYQTPLLRRDVFLQGLAALNTQSGKSYKKHFPDLADAEKDEILKMCEAGKIPTEGFSSAYFFSLLRTAVLAGVYADPIYGGNSAMNGWKMKEYPGAQMAYDYMIEDKGFVKIDPLSLADMQ